MTFHFHNQIPIPKHETLKSTNSYHAKVFKKTHSYDNFITLIDMCDLFHVIIVTKFGIFPR